ncbi:Z1 domain-containing protein [Thiobacillus sp.]|uniref:Z1 domain-containing protein n=1 Tax=Thiobacillus sp. TaxID=924 RepID=UPI0025F68D71|nr:Z1 domain-containing protein [Thiobacillus sp.]
MLENMVGAQLAKEPIPTPQRIRELIETVRNLPFCANVSSDEAERLALEFEERHGVEMKIGAFLTKTDYEPWLDTARASIIPYYWNRYRQLLVQQGFSGHVLATLDDVTDRILSLLENPQKPGRWDRRGMVVGHVQSGKTANYTGLICKAADAGYRLIIVIAGVHNNLRNQTQIRIDEGFVGRDSARMLTTRDEQVIGVGKFDSSRRPVTFTNSVRDFNKVMATGVGVPLQNLNEPAIFVIKKESNTLKNLLEWLKEHSARGGTDSVDAPMLLIDDEADNASINTKHGKGEVTRINGQIRDLLNMFERSCYVGYTATPFANIFIDPATDDEMRGADLFPKDFIVSLDPPTNYFGANRVFLEDADRIIRHIDDNEERLPLKHATDFTVTTLPPSLVTAVRAFVVAKAIRIARGQVAVHCSMLVNASIKNAVQRQLRNELHIALEELQASVRVNAALPPAEALRDPAIRALHEVWADEYEDTAGCDWPAVQKRLHEAAASIRTVLINSKSADVLDYAGHAKTGLSVIAVGGFSLSRGLTLEGLMVSYFLRNSMMYDTLMQMGRWFGYRQGYDDLCRVWMPEEAEGWYTHIAEAIEELREELRIMQAANATPEQFGLKVRSHPDTLIVTARNKMGSGEKLRVSIGLGERFAETAILKRDPASLAANRLAARQLADKLAEAGKPLSSAAEVTGGRLLQGVPPGMVEEFISAFQNHPGSMLTEPGPVRRYIEDRRDTELASWDVLFTGVKTPDAQGLTDVSLGIPIYCQRRSAGNRSDCNTLRVTNKQRVASRGVEKTGLTPAQIEGVEKAYREAEGKENYPDRIYRRMRERPLLIVHLLAIGNEHEDLRGQKPTVAWSISFPRTAMEEMRVEYVVNTTWWKENYRDELDDDEIAGDDV